MCRVRSQNALLRCKNDASWTLISCDPCRSRVSFPRVYRVSFAQSPSTKCFHCHFQHFRGPNVSALCPIRSHLACSHCSYYDAVLHLTWDNALTRTICPILSVLLLKLPLTRGYFQSGSRFRTDAPPLRACRMHFPRESRGQHQQPRADVRILESETVHAIHHGSNTLPHIWTTSA